MKVSADVAFEMLRSSIKYIPGMLPDLLQVRLLGLEAESPYIFGHVPLLQCIRLPMSCWPVITIRFSACSSTPAFPGCTPLTSVHGSGQGRWAYWAYAWARAES